MSSWRKSHGFDQVQLKILMRAFAMTGHLRGVWWCMMTALSRQEPVLYDFVVEAKRLLPQLEKQYSHRDSKSYEEQNMQQLNHLMVALEEKAAGRPHWKTVYACPETKQRLPSTGIESLVQSFDEEMEMDWLQNRTQVDFYTLQSLWDENRMVTERLVQPEEAEYPTKVPKVQAAVA